VCGTRFTTYEHLEERPLQVLKSDGSVQDFDRAKLFRSLRIACAKRPVGTTEMDAIVDSIIEELSRRARAEVPSSEIGELVMGRLAPLDRVAYIRFASVYRNFQDIGEFQDVVHDLHTRDAREFVSRDQEELPF
jgi:transcriptional repressor NrdR